jgi:hypothetical protein
MAVTNFLGVMPLKRRENTASKGLKTDTKGIQAL